MRGYMKMSEEPKNAKKSVRRAERRSWMIEEYKGSGSS